MHMRDGVTGRAKILPHSHATRPQLATLTSIIVASGIMMILLFEVEVQGGNKEYDVVALSFARFNTVRMAHERRHARARAGKQR